MEEAAFFFALFAFSVNDFGLASTIFASGFFPPVTSTTARRKFKPDLRGSESDALGSVHGGEHIFGELL